MYYFSMPYFFNTSPIPNDTWSPYYLLAVPYAFVSLGTMSFANVSVVRKISLVLSLTLAGTIVGSLLIFVTMFIPGSREHNYVHKHRCVPIVKDLYISHGEQFDMGYGTKAWDDHTRCERNFYEGKALLEGIE